jgi:hypothetical protein
LSVEGQHGLAVNRHDTIANAPVHGQLKVLMGGHEPTQDVTQGTDRDRRRSDQQAGLSTLITQETFSTKPPHTEPHHLPIVLQTKMTKTQTNTRTDLALFCKAQ